LAYSKEWKEAEKGQAFEGQSPTSTIIIGISLDSAMYLRSRTLY
jgi:hypothetical protein